MVLLTDLTDRSAGLLMSAGTARHLDRGVTFYPGDADPSELFLLRTGKGEVFHLSAERRKLTLSILGPGKVFGEQVLLDHPWPGGGAVAIEDSVAWAIPRAKLLALMGNNPGLATWIAGMVAKRLQRATAALSAMAFSDLTGRVAALLLSLAGDDRLVLGYAHSDLATMVGCLRESMTGVLDRFKRSGAITIGRRRVLILDRPQLERIVAQRTGRNLTARDEGRRESKPNNGV